MLECMALLYIAKGDKDGEIIQEKVRSIVAGQPYDAKDIAVLK